MSRRRVRHEDEEMPPIVEPEVVHKIYNGVDYSRQMKIFNPFDHAGKFITIVGAGAVGSMTTVVLTKMGFRNLIVWDDDVVTPENLPNQFYPISSVGKTKVLALQEIVQMFTGLDIIPMQKRWKEAEHREVIKQFPDDAGILIMCTDNMASRKMCYEYYCKEEGMEELYIDARMGGLVYRVFLISPRAAEKCTYPLYSDDASHQDPCTAKSIIFNVGTIASTIAGLISKYYTNGDRMIYREVIGDMKNLRVIDAEDVAKLMDVEKVS